MRRGEWRKWGIVACLVVAVGVMTTLVSYSVTLYRLFCSVTGAGGTTQRVAADTAAVSPHTVTVFFNTDVAPGLPWHFVPLQRSVTVHLGEQTPVFFEARNDSDHDIVGRATFNVTPDKAGVYFKKIECFCFTEERLAAHRTVQMPVEFYVDPAMATNPGTRDVDQITLSYTFFEAKKPQAAPDLARFDDHPDAKLGATLFASQCSACHAPDRAIVGPPLAGVVGRRAASVPGYPYSKALAASGIVWTDAALDRWLTDPQADVPGATMPMKVTAATARHDIVAYLATLAPPKSEAGGERAPAG